MKMHEEPPAEISHAAHPEHKLRLVATGGGPPFRCDGCKEPGDGKGRRYRCAAADACEFDLHTCCALAAPTLKHALLGDLEFKLLLLPPEAAPPRPAAPCCSACGDVARGLVYHCGSKKQGGLSLHPFCAALRAETVLPDGHHLQLCDEAKLRCAVCGEKGRQVLLVGRKLWAYRWRHDGAEGYLHVACMKKIAVQSWEQPYLMDRSLLEASVPIMKGVLRRRSPPGTGTGTGTTGHGAEIVEGGLQLGASIVAAVSST